MNKYVSISTLFLLALGAVCASQFQRSADAGVFGTRCLDQTGCAPRCPACDHQCDLKAEQGEEDRLCFDIETKAICIPRVVFPWQMKSFTPCDSCDGHGCSNCIHNGARVRKVCVLKPSSFQCPKCKYTWSAERRDVCRNGCDAGAGACDAVPGVDALQAPRAENSELNASGDNPERKEPSAEGNKQGAPASKQDAGSVEELPPPTASHRPLPTRLPPTSLSPFSRW